MEVMNDVYSKETRSLLNNSKADFSHRSCGDLAYRTSTDDPSVQCAFARTCNGGDGGFLLSFAFCDNMSNVSDDGENQQKSYWGAKSLLLLILSPFLIILLIVLFRMLGSTAEDFFSPCLEMFSRRCRLPPRLAGVTLLALGNGAPDISATLNAVVDDPLEGTQLCLGSLTGGGMFVGTIVAGSIFLLGRGDHHTHRGDSRVGGATGSSTSLIRCRGAMVRDVM
eukprot:10067587-Ditylum_brightwellii.AAC.1